jgi:RimJ/RimL family protein N-acetyltransferase
MSIKWKNVELIDVKKGVGEKEANFLYSCYQDYRARNLFTNDMYVKSMNTFINKMEKNMIYKYDDFMLIKSESSKEIVGFIYTYGHKANDGNIKVTMYIEPNKRNSIYGAQGSLAFFDYLFNKYSIRKVYCNVYSYNEASSKILEGLNFKLEGRLKKHRYFDNDYYDVLIYALYKNDFNKLKERFNKK